MIQPFMSYPKVIREFIYSMQLKWAVVGVRRVQTLAPCDCTKGGGTFTESCQECSGSGTVWKELIVIEGGSPSREVLSGRSIGWRIAEGATVDL